MSATSENNDLVYAYLISFGELLSMGGNLLFFGSSMCLSLKHESRLLLT